MSGPRSLALGALLLLVAVGASASSAACGSDDPAGVAVVPDGGRADADAAVVPPTGLCVDGKPTSAWPPGPYEIALTSVLPPGLTFEGPSGPVKLDAYYEPCAARSRLLVIRSTAAWCGPCIWHATHTTRLVGDARWADRLLLLDLLLADEDNMPPTAAAVVRWQKRIDVPTAPAVDAKIAIDAKYTFSTVLPAKNLLPEYVFIDTRTMRVRTVLSNPDPETLLGFYALELASLDGLPRPAVPQRVLHDELLTDDQYDLLQGMKLVPAPPADPTNEFGDVPAAVALGKKLFGDTSLSPSNTVACVTCHDPTKAFGDGLKQAVGAGTGDRNSPPVALAAHARWQFWDGRADTLWMQALGPFENAKEFASTRLFVAHAIADRYAAEYNAVFGVKYTLPDISALPAAGKPGQPAYDALSQADRDAVTRIFVNTGKAIAAFERSLRVKPNDLDRYAGGDLSILGTTQKRALQGFFKGGCTQCHWGPRLTDDAFHNLRFPTGRQDRTADPGRANVLLGLANAEFVAASKWSDAPSAARPLLFTTVPPSMVGAFKTPTLRGVSASAPYGHGGSFAQLLQVTQHYGQRAMMVPPAQASGTVEEWVPNFDVIAQTELPALLDLLTAEPEP